MQAQFEEFMANRTHDTDVAFVQALAELLRANDLTELEVSRDYGPDQNLVVRVARQIEAAPVTHVMSAPAPVAAPAAAAAAPRGEPSCSVEVARWIETLGFDVLSVPIADWEYLETSEEKVEYLREGFDAAAAASEA